MHIQKSCTLNEFICVKQPIISTVGRVVSVRSLGIALPAGYGMNRLKGLLKVQDAGNYFEARSVLDRCCINYLVLNPPARCVH